MKISRILGTGIAALSLLAASYLGAGRRYSAAGLQGAVRSVVAYYNWTGFYVGINGGYSWGEIGLTRVPAVVQHQPERMVGRRHGRLQLPGRLVGARASRATRTGPTSRKRPCGAFSCEIKNSWLAHRPWPHRLCLRPLAAVLHRRRGASASVEANSKPGGGGVERHRPAGPSASASNTPSSATGRPRSNISTSISAASTQRGVLGSGRRGHSVDYKANVVRAGLNYKFSGPIFSRY